MAGLTPQYVIGESCKIRKSNVDGLRFAGASIKKMLKAKTTEYIVFDLEWTGR